MYHCTVQFEKPPAKIGTPGSAGMLATGKNAIKSRKANPTTAGPPATASSKGTAEMLATQ